MSGYSNGRRSYYAPEPELESPFVNELPWSRNQPVHQPFLGEGGDEAETYEDRFEGYAGEDEADFEDVEGEGTGDEGAEFEDAWSEGATFEEEAFEEEAHVCRGCGRALEAEADFEALGEEEDEQGDFEREDDKLGFEDLALEDDQFALWEAEADGRTPLDVSDFARTLGAEWSQRRNGKPAPGPMAEWLKEDYVATFNAAVARFTRAKKARLRKNPRSKYQVPSAESLTRAWMVSIRQKMLFQEVGFPGVKSLGKLVPPPASVTLVTTPKVEGSDEERVAPLTIAFAEELRRRHKGTRLFTYGGHGGGAFEGRGYSLDLNIENVSLDDRGFYKPDDAIQFLKAVHDAATAVGVQWRVIYNDYSVAEAVNRALGKVHVIYVGGVRKGAKNINWHGPDPLILHFHVDLGELKGAPSTWKGGVAGTTAASEPPPPVTSTPASTTTTGTTTSARPTAPQVRFAQGVLNAVAGEKLAVDGDLGAKTRGALERFRQANGLGSGGVLDGTTELALAQRALEELRQQSVFPQVGVRDAVTDQELSRFKSDRGLGFDATIDNATRAALVEALRQRSGGGATGGAAPSRSTSSPSTAPSGSLATLEAQLLDLVRESWRREGIPPPEASQLGKPKKVKSGYARYISKGLFVDDTAEILRDRGLVTISADDIDMLQRAANVETGGRLTALNSWDSAVMSVGFMQWTLKYSKLVRWIEAVPSVFAKYGIELEPSRRYAFSAKNKQRAIIGATKAVELRNLEWGARFYFASLDLGAIVAEYKQALVVTQEVRRSIVDPHGSAIVAHYNADPVLRALVQETHNNRPAYMKAAMANAAAKARAEGGVSGSRFMALVQAQIRAIYVAKEGADAAKKAANLIKKTAVRRL